MGCRYRILIPALIEFMSNLRKLIPSAHSLLVFEAAARLQSFKAAAIEIHVTQPSVSHAIRAMEDQLGLRLLERGNRGVRLTRAGSELMADLAPAREPAAQHQGSRKPYHNGSGINLCLGTVAAAGHGSVPTQHSRRQRQDHYHRPQFGAGQRD